ncbi:glutamate racemase [Candidatus Peregrinibacteria bacterium CG11_big_fil_rev_8_21_14_0_20_46_8]|nr:MAG: glutamate racemase [Candidatus Peregrinibacteria bacterium CG11_big_fil_rev_8_21_14_0_20_46_8]
MIGIFDSGFGGLTVAQEIIGRLPEYDYLYVGDNARAPYGGRSKEVITQFSEEAVQYLWSRGARLIIFACFTASAQALRELQQRHTDKKILGVVRPIVEEAVRAGTRIGVVGTRATIASHAFRDEIHKLAPNAEVIEKATPLLVPFIEEGWHTKPEARMILKKYLTPLKSHNIDTLIHGCTHYPFMHKDFERIMGKNVNVLRTGKIVAESLADYLQRHPEIETQLSKKSAREFCTTDCTERFELFAQQNLTLKIGTVEKIALM